MQATNGDKVIIVGGSSRNPAVQNAIIELPGKEPSEDIKPDECVSMGAAIVGGMLSGGIHSMCKWYFTPLSIGIESRGGVFTKIIERYTTIPNRRSLIISTATDNQSSVVIHVLEGENEMAAYNKTLGTFILSDIPPAPRGVPQIEVTFDIDLKGILNVIAKDKGTGREQKVVMKS